MNVFHNGPPAAADNITPVTDGFKWVSWISDQGAADLHPSAPVTIILTGPNGKRTPAPVKCEPQDSSSVLSEASAALSGLTSLLCSLGISTDLATPTATESSPSTVITGQGVEPLLVPGGRNPWDLLQSRATPTEAGVIYDIPFQDDSPQGNELYQPSYIDEDIFIRPFLSIISSPEFFINGTTGSVVFKTDLLLKHGKVPWQIAVAILLLPLLWTFVLVVLANRHKRWTASLDAFAMFRLGGDWRGNLKHLRLASLTESKKELQTIPGTIQVDPDEGIVELAHLTRTAFDHEAPDSQKEYMTTGDLGAQSSLLCAGSNEEQAVVATGRPDSPVSQMSTRTVRRPNQFSRG